MSSCTGPPVPAAEQILGVKGGGMLLQLLASHHQSQSTLYEAVAWAKNVFQKRALEKHLLVGDCGHIFLMFPLLIVSPLLPWRDRVWGGLSDFPVAVSVSCILQYSSSSLVVPHPAE